jgi:hypothetical protein
MDRGSSGDNHTSSRRHWGHSSSYWGVPMDVNRVSTLSGLLVVLALAEDDLRRARDYAVKMMNQQLEADQIAEAISAELIRAKRALNAGQVVCRELVMRGIKPACHCKEF